MVFFFLFFSPPFLSFIFDVLGSESVLSVPHSRQKTFYRKRPSSLPCGTLISTSCSGSYQDVSSIISSRNNSKKNCLQQAGSDFDDNEDEGDASYIEIDEHENQALMAAKALSKDSLLPTEKEKSLHTCNQFDDFLSTKDGGYAKPRRKTVQDLLLADSDDSDISDEDSDDDKGSFEDASLLKRLAEENSHTTNSPIHPTIPPAVFNYISALDAKQELTTLPPQHDPYHDDFAVCTFYFINNDLNATKKI